MISTNTSSPRATPAGDYRFCYTYIEPLAMAAALPEGESPSFRWKVLVAEQLIKLVVNTLVANRGDEGAPGPSDDVANFLRLVLVKTWQAQGTSFKLKLAKLLLEIYGPKPQSGSGLVAPTTGLQVVIDASPSGQTTDAPPTDIDTAVAISRGIEQALQEMLKELPADDVTPQFGTSKPNTTLEKELGNAPPAATVAEAQVKTVVSENIKAALQEPLAQVPANTQEVESFLKLDLIRQLGSDFLKLLGQNVLKYLKEKAPSGKANSIEDYVALFAAIQPPAGFDTYRSDASFAYMRVAGPNPVMLERVTEPDSRFPVTDEHYRAAMGEADSLERAIAEGRVYRVDYGAMAGAIGGTYGPDPQMQKYAYAPLALFAVPADAPGTERSLRPIAIQCGQSPGEHPIITRRSGEDPWLMAKTIVQIADANYHEAVTHFARTHLLIEPFVVTTHLRLPATHPLFQLLVPHFEGTLTMNFAAHKFLVAPGGGVDSLLSSTIDNSRVLIVRGFQATGFNADMLPVRLEARGVDEPEKLPVYPYRDDALLVWNAIREWVEGYLGLSYASDAEVVEDTDLSAWAATLVAFDGGRLRDFGDEGDGRIQTREYLYDAVTMIIFTASAQHAAVNFPQAGLMSFAPAVPTAGYLDAHEVTAPGTDPLALLPPLDQAQAQLNLLQLLGSVYYTKLGNYNDGAFSNPKVTQPNGSGRSLLGRFQDRLQEIDQAIDRRNREHPQHPFVYDYLKPSNIPQSINI